VAIELNGTKVSLRPKSIADARRDYHWQKDAELMAFSGNPPLKESFLEYLAQSMTSYSPTEQTEVFAIRTLEDNRHIGNCALYEIDREESVAQLGITIGDRDFWCKGFGEDAVNLLARYAFETMRLQRVWLKTLEDNIRAFRCFQKSGFSPCGSIYREGRYYILMEKLNQTCINESALQE
jgi:RimJ/RimL family protein N-acetyltransferase